MARPLPVNACGRTRSSVKPPHCNSGNKANRHVPQKARPKNFLPVRQYLESG